VVSAKKHSRPCVVCGTVFFAPPSGNKSCSKQCAAVLISAGPRTHGGSCTRLYALWSSMKARCTRNSQSQLCTRYYLGQVFVCDEWNSSFVAFRDWALQNGYADTLELDRINPRGNYCPENCRWATRSQQMANIRKRKDGKTSVFKGVSRHSQNGTFVAQIVVRKKYRNLGSFTTALKAALAYDSAARAANGEFARINFPEMFNNKEV